MADFVSESFAGTSGEALSDYNPDWVDSGGSFIISNGARLRLRGTAAGSNKSAYHSAVPPSADYSVRASVAPLSLVTNSSMGVMARRSTGADTCYFARLSVASGWQLYKRLAGVNSQLGSSVAQALTAGDTYAIELRVTGSTIEVYGAGDPSPKISVTDTSITDAGRAGVFVSQSGSVGDSTGWHLDDLFAGDVATVEDEISGGDADDNRIYQRSGSGYALTLSGIYTGTLPTSIEARIIAASDGETVEQDWIALTSVTIDSGNWSGVLSAPQGGMYRVQVRSKDGATVLHTGALGAAVWGVGDLIACAGSSSAERWFESGTFTPSDTIRIYTGSGWHEFGVSGNGAAVNLANTLTTALGVPIGMMSCGVGGSTVAQWSSTAYSGYVSLRNAITEVGGKIAGLLTMCGSNDAANSIVLSKADHAGLYAEWIQNVRNHTAQPSLPVFISGTQRRTSGSADEQWNWVREAEKDLATAANVYLAATTVDLPLADGVHLTPGGYETNLQRVALCMLDVWGSGTYHSGPKITSIGYSGDTVTVDLMHFGGTDFTPSSGITGFAVTDDVGALTITAAFRSSATQITLMLDRSVGDGVVVTYLSGASPTVTSPVLDNTTAALPLEYETEVVAVVVGANLAQGDIAAIILGAAAASASGQVSMQASPATLSLVSAQGESTTAASAAGTAPSLTLVAPAGTANTSTETVASGDLAPLSLTAPAGMSSGSAQSFGSVPHLALVPPPASAEGIPVTTADASFAPLAFVPPVAASDVLTIVSGLVPEIALVPPHGDASSGDVVEAFGSFAALGLPPPQGLSVVRAAAVGAHPSLRIVPPAAFASDGSPMGAARAGFIAGAALQRRYVA